MNKITETAAAIALEKCNLFSRKLAGFKSSIAKRKENNKGNNALFPMMTRKPKPIKVITVEANFRINGNL